MLASLDAAQNEQTKKPRCETSFGGGKPLTLAMPEPVSQVPVTEEVGGALAADPSSRRPDRPPERKIALLPQGAARHPAALMASGAGIDAPVVSLHQAQPLAALPASLGGLKRKHESDNHKGVVAVRLTPGESQPRSAAEVAGCVLLTSEGAHGGNDTPAPVQCPNMGAARQVAKERVNTLPESISLVNPAFSKSGNSWRGGAGTSSSPAQFGPPMNRARQNIC